MISVIIPLYNKEKQIANAIKSVLSQTYKDFEIVIVNDGSTDRGIDEVANFSDERIRLVTQRNAGVSAARNRGIKEAKGEYVAFLDADDEWDGAYLESINELIQKYPDCGVYASNYQFRTSTGAATPTIIRNITFNHTDGLLSNYFTVASTSHPPLWTSAVVVCKQAIEKVGGFPTGIKSGEDILTWARLAVENSIAYSLIPRATYNLGDGYDYSNLPPRRQDQGDPVGKALKELYAIHPEIKDLKLYISHWHKMRASVAIRFGERIETLKEVALSLKYNPVNFRVLPFAVLAICPDKLRKRIIGLKKSV